MYYFYILRCRDNSLYCGWTTDLERRVREHNLDKKKSARYTWSRKPVILVYFEKFSTSKEAMQREIQVKKLTKSNKELLIYSHLTNS